MDTNTIKEDELNNNKVDKKWIFPYEIKKIDHETNQRLLKDFKGERSNFVQVGPKKWFFPSGYARDAPIYYNFQARPDDVWIVTFPRSGTTWTQEMVWMLANNLDYNTAKEKPLVDRVPFLEFSSFVHEEVKQEFLQQNIYSQEKQDMVNELCKETWKSLQLTPGRRFIKTHLPFSLLPPNLLEVGCKVIYVARHPKNVAVSFYHLNRLMKTQGYQNDFPTYWNYFQENLQPWTPYWDHIIEGWDKRNENNLLFMFYEDLNKDTRKGIEKFSDFLGYSYTNEELNGLEDHLKLENFRNNKSVNFSNFKEVGLLTEGEQDFVRKGKNGGWSSYFDKELNEKADIWIEENLKRTDLRFPL